MICRMEGCGEELDTLQQMSAHYRTAHKGERSPRAKAKPDQPQPATAEVDSGGSTAWGGEPPPTAGEGLEIVPSGPSSDTPPPGSWRDKLWGGGRRRDTSAPPSSSPRRGREKAPSPKRKRNNTATIWEMIWGGIGTALIRTDADPAVGRCMQYQAIVAGDILDRATRDTILDRVIQPLAGKVDEMEAVGALLGLPLLVAVVERSPEMAVALEPMLRAAVQAQLVAMVPAMKRQEAKLKEVQGAVDELGLEGADPVGALLDAMLRPPDAPPAGPPNGNGAGNVDGRVYA